MNRLCKDCKHIHVKEKLLGVFDSYAGATCKLTDFVAGTGAFGEPCVSERNSGPCGIEGKNFEALEEKL
jgi:hypothetical protein